MPGVVDTSLPPAQQRQQLQDKLVAQGFTDVEAQSLAEQWMTTGTVAGSSQPVIAIDSVSAQPPADPFAAASPGGQGLTDTSTDSEVMAAYLREQGYDGFDLINAGWTENLNLGRSYEFIKGFAQGTVFSGIATGEALLEVAKNPGQFVQSLTALVNSPEARAQLGEAVLNQFKTDLRLFEDAYDSGDWKTAGQAAGKITTDFAQIAGGVQAIASLGVATARAGGRLLLSTAEDVAFGRTVTLAGPQVRTAEIVNAAQKAALETPSWLKGTQVITEVVPKGTPYYMVITADDAALINRGIPKFGGWATPDAVSSQAFARDALAIAPSFKRDVSYVILVETTDAQIVSKGFAGPIGSAQGTGSQVQFVEYGKLKIVGSPQLLPVN